MLETITTKWQTNVYNSTDLYNNECISTCLDKTKLILLKTWEMLWYDSNIKYDYASCLRNTHVSPSYDCIQNIQFFSESQFKVLKIWWRFIWWSWSDCTMYKVHVNIPSGLSWKITHKMSPIKRTWECIKDMRQSHTYDHGSHKITVLFLLPIALSFLIRASRCSSAISKCEMCQISLLN